MSFYPCELHCHTIHSDGGFLPEQLQESAVKNKYALIASTDHNTFSAHRDMKDEIIPFIRGIEWTTYFGHVLVLGAKQFVDWRDAIPDNIDKKLKEIKDASGIVGVAHPYQKGAPICTGGRWEFNVKDWNLVDYIEIFHERFYPGNIENIKGVEFWTNLLDKGYHLAATYGRDWHRPSNEGHFGLTYLDMVRVSEDDALKAIKMGRTIVSSGMKLDVQITQEDKEYKLGDTLKPVDTEFVFDLDLNTRKEFENIPIVANEIRIVTNNSRIVKSLEINEKSTNIILENNHWYRIEIWGQADNKETLLCVTSPIYT